MNFQDLHLRFVVFLQERVRSGQVTERGLARMTGISQPHIHNVLSGKRALSPELSDQILQRLHLDVLDLMRNEDFSEWSRRQ
jgi:plasmid maintenance system antidote protein VapI